MYLNIDNFLMTFFLDFDYLKRTGTWNTAFMLCIPVMCCNTHRKSFNLHQKTLLFLSRKM